MSIIVSAMCTGLFLLRLNPQKLAVIEGWQVDDYLN